MIVYVRAGMFGYDKEISYICKDFDTAKDRVEKARKMKQRAIIRPYKGDADVDRATGNG